MFSEHMLVALPPPSVMIIFCPIWSFHSRKKFSCFLFRIDFDSRAHLHSTSSLAGWLALSLCSLQVASGQMVEPEVQAQPTRYQEESSLIRYVFRQD